ncbi:MAG: hypothetical protein CMJ33_01615 [Phycisphaerae bacterium]|nr:hypothetical protein [Phycisphaerae bacterium]HAW96710.1 hypothetical protein [Phycisphaerales bacterium]|tara:strand:+ start:925 stop:1770 length:846 start_codon:yes stop_codon:yes gene_type:complete
MGNRLLKYMLVSYGVSALIGILSILGGAGSLTLNMLGTSLTISGGLTLLLLAFLLAHSGNQRIKWLMYVCAGLSCLCALKALLLIWSLGDSDLAFRIFFAMLTLCLSGLHIGYLFFWKRLNTLFRVTVWLLAFFNIVLVTVIMLGLFYQDFYGLLFKYVDDEFFARCISAIIMLVLIGTMSLPVMNLVLRGRHHASDQGMSDRRVQVPISCPRCGFACHLKVGHVTCPQCKLVMKFEVEEPRCSCGYLLYRFDGESCPECSRAIPGHLRWEHLSRNSESSD